MSSVLPSLVILGLLAVIALRLAQSRSSPLEAATERIAASTVLGVTTGVQCAHFTEELVTGFHARFPALMGLDPMPLSFFVPFNLAWIAIWVISIPLLRLGRKPAFFAAWFLAIAGILNGIAHPMMAVASGGYFPGLITSPFNGVTGVILWQRLHKATAGSIRAA